MKVSSLKELENFEKEIKIQELKEKNQKKKKKRVPEQAKLEGKIKNK